MILDVIIRVLPTDTNHQCLAGKDEENWPTPVEACCEFKYLLFPMEADSLQLIHLQDVQCGKSPLKLRVNA